MNYDQIKKSILEWGDMLSPRMRKYIHYRSMRNCVLHFDEIKSGRDRNKILVLLSEYVECVCSNDYSFDRNSSAELAVAYLFPLVDYYRGDSHFVRVIKPQEALIVGFLVDSLLFLTNILSSLRYIPITTMLLFLYYLYLRIFKIPKGRVYGMFY